MFSRIMLSLCVLILLSETGREITIAQTPFSFVRRPDVAREINIAPPQIDRVQQLQPLCDAKCRQRLRQTLGSVDSNTRRAYEALSPTELQQANEWLERDVRESVELEILDRMVLNDPQMNRFRELWTQFLGLDALTVGDSSRRLGMSPIQINQIQQIQDIGSEAIQGCRQNSDLTPEQQGVQIQNIQNIIIDQSITILSDVQINQFLDMQGDSCRFDPPENGDGDEITGSGGDLPIINDRILRGGNNLPRVSNDEHQNADDRNVRSRPVVSNAQPRRSPTRRNAGRRINAPRPSSPGQSSQLRSQGPGASNR